LNTLFIFVGGHARQNNGDSGIGLCYHTDPRGEPFFEEAEYIGLETQNSTVYHAIIRALNRASEWHFKDVQVYLDNRLVAGQLNENMSVRAQNIIPLYDRIKKLAEGIERFTISYVSADKNRRSRELAKSAAIASPDRITAQAIEFEVKPGINGLVMAFTPKMMVVRFTYQEGTWIDFHSHYHEQASYLTKGLLKYVVADQDILMTPGAALVVSGNSDHKIEALEDTTEIVIYSPMRWDLLNIS